MIDFTSFFITFINALYTHLENRNKELLMSNRHWHRKYLVRNLPINKKLLIDSLLEETKLAQEFKKKNEGNIDIERMINNFNQIIL